MAHEHTVIIYHGKCPDGFGGAFAAWKKFGGAAEYIPANYGDPIAEHLAGREVYLVDFCYEDKAGLAELVRTTKKLVVLDHHESARKTIEALPNHVFDANRSGASIAWSYFHPETPLPRLMRYLEDGDLYRHALPETEEIFSYLLAVPYEFDAWDELCNDLEDDATRDCLLEKAHNYDEYFRILGDMSAGRATKVLFEGYECFFVATHPYITMKSYVGAKLYKKCPPFALVVTAHPNGFGVSIRGDGSVDVSKIAQKYGGGGHTSSAGFFIPNGEQMPWKEVEE